jgi:hypothetical protein
MSEEAKRYIQAAAWNRFPAQELWIRADNHFWAFDIEGVALDQRVTFTEGVFEVGDIVFNSVVHFPPGDAEVYVEEFCERKRGEGFECFAIQMRN